VEDLLEPPPHRLQRGELHRAVAPPEVGAPQRGQGGPDKGKGQQQRWPSRWRHRDLKSQENPGAGSGLSPFVAEPDEDAGNPTIGFVAPVIVDDGPERSNCSNCSKALLAIRRALELLEDGDVEAAVITLRAALGLDHKHE